MTLGFWWFWSFFEDFGHLCYFNQNVQHGAKLQILNLTDDFSPPLEGRKDPQINTDPDEHELMIFLWLTCWQTVKCQSGVSFPSALVCSAQPEKKTLQFLRFKESRENSH